jgi:hypothetical protein
MQHAPGRPASTTPHHVFKPRTERVCCSDHSLDREANMQFRTTGMLMLGAIALSAAATAQPAPAPPAITRTVVAATKLPTVTDVPLHFRAVSVTLPAGETSSVSLANGILYQLSGSTEVSLGLPTLLLGPRCGFGSARRDGTGDRERIIPHLGTNPGPEARRLRSQSDAGHISGADAIQPATPSVRSGSVFHRLRHGSQHDQWHDSGTGTRCSGL